MEKVIIIRYAEIHLKGKNRGYFEHVFSVNLERSLRGIRHELHRTNGRYLVAKFEESRAEEIASRIARVFGIHSYSHGYRTESSMEAVFEAAMLVSPKSGTFKVETHRGDKRYPLTSPEISRELGARLLAQYPALNVDVHTPQAAVYVDIRENGFALVFGSYEKGVGGMPVSTSGKGLLLISGGIDSPVAGYMMAKRGMCVNYLHFHSYPYTSDMAKEKVLSLAKQLSRYAHTGRDPREVRRRAECHAAAPVHVPHCRIDRVEARRPVPDYGRKSGAGCEPNDRGHDVLERRRVAPRPASARRV